MGFCKYSMFIGALLLCNHLDGEERAGALLSLSSWCLMLVVWLFLVVLHLWVCLQFVNVVFPDHITYYLKKI